MPPSSVVRFEPRSGSLREPLIVVPSMVGPPLSLKKTISVSPSTPPAQGVEHLADASSSAVSIAAYVRRDSSLMDANRLRRSSVACIGV